MAKKIRSSELAKSTKTVSVQNDRPIEKQFPLSKQSGDPTIPIRTVLTVEIGDMNADLARQVVKSVTDKYVGNEHPHYIIPTRSGKIPSDILFEQEFLDLVRMLCEVKDGKIELRGGAKDLQIVRKRL